MTTPPSSPSSLPPEGEVSSCGRPCGTDKAEHPPAGWQVQARPPVMTRRFEFSDYAATRAFLDGLARLSETTGHYPDLNFAKTHVSVTLAARDTALGADEYAFADQVDALAGKG